MGIKIGVLSDTHLERAGTEIKDIYESYLSDMDLIVHVGDYVSKEIVEFLDRGNFHGVYGNMDPMQVREMLPQKKIIQVGSHRIGLIHGWGSYIGLEQGLLSEFRDVDMIIYGHTHKPANLVKEKILLFNPGTAVGYHRHGTHTIGILDIGEKVSGEIINI